jgi:membrane carboxypeptidase/penicillin-binding protein
MRIRSKRVRILVALLIVVVGLPIVHGAVTYCIVYARTPELVDKLRATSTMELEAKALPEEYLRILLVVEDPCFFSHCGVDLRTPGAGITTITQGLAKRIYFHPFRPGFAKIKQTLAAVALNRRVSKWDQLDLFLNCAYFGSWDGREILGFGEAARVYFAKDFHDLTRGEYVSLVAMIIAPNTFHPIRNPEKTAERVRRIERLLAGECVPSGLMDVYYEHCGS